MTALLSAATWVGLGLAAAMACLTACNEGGSRDPVPASAPVIQDATAPRAEPRVAEWGPFGAFAYADSAGARLHVLGPSRPDSIAEAICRSGAVVPVRYLGRQPRGQRDNGRQRAFNFDQDEGDVFALGDYAVQPDETCFLATPALGALGSLRPGAVAPDSVCPPAAASRVAAARARAVVRCGVITAVDPTTDVLAVEFESRGDSALASLVVVDPARLAFLDFPAVHGPEGDTWRVGDGGVFQPDAFAVLFVVRGPDVVALAIAWSGEEGESLTLAVSDSSLARLVPAIRSYRYTLPE